MPGKHAAPARRTRWVVAAVVVILVVAVVAGVFLYHNHMEQQQRVDALHDALNALADTDATVIALDQAVGDPLNDAAVSGDAVSSSALTAAQGQLDAAEQQVAAAAEGISGAKDKEAAVQAHASIAARGDMIDAGQILLYQAQPARTAAKQADELWDGVIEADEQVRSAAALVSDTTQENVQASLDRLHQALSTFNDAHDAFANLQQSYPAADFSSITTYLDKRCEALGYAISSDEAILARDTAKATEQNDRYNTADADAAKLAQSLPFKPSSIVREAYEHSSKQESEAYVTARSQAASADAFIRDYLGGSSN